MLKTYEEKVNTITQAICEIAHIVVNSNKNALNLIKSSKIEDLKEINISIKKLTIKSNEIDNLIITTLALYSPEAKDLRLMVAYLKITNELLRAASNCKTFIKGFRKSYSEEINSKEILEYVVPLLKASNEALETTIKMILSHDEDEIEQIDLCCIIKV